MIRQFAAVCLVICGEFYLAISEKCSVCSQSRTLGLRSADCYDGGFKSFPQCLRTDMEIIDLSSNRLRKITKEDLARYTNLKMLYLYDNIIMKIEENTFADLNSLQSLDISLNAFTKIPPTIFKLPSLKRLYLSNNQNMNLADSIENAKPITSPLEYLDIGYNDLETIPLLGIMPHLLVLNISGSDLLDFKTKHVAGLCTLRVIINENFSVFFKDKCDCWNLEKWLIERKVTFTSFQCEGFAQECSDPIPEEDVNEYNQCKDQIKQMEFRSNAIKIGIPIAVVILLVVIIGVWFVHRRRKRRIQNSKLTAVSQKILSNGHDDSY